MNRRTARFVFIPSAMFVALFATAIVTVNNLLFGCVPVLPQTSRLHQVFLRQLAGGHRVRLREVADRPVSAGCSPVACQNYDQPEVELLRQRMAAHQQVYFKVFQHFLLYCL
jgi:hypothetical protein